MGNIIRLPVWIFVLVFVVMVWWKPDMIIEFIDPFADQLLFWFQDTFQ